MHAATNILVIGASVSGLACSSVLQKNNLEYFIIENKTMWEQYQNK
jgi:hypothetical protein